MNSIEFVLVRNKCHLWVKDEEEEQNKRDSWMFRSYKRLDLFGNKLILCILMVTCLKSISAQISEGKCTFFRHSFVKKALYANW